VIFYSNTKRTKFTKVILSFRAETRNPVLLKSIPDNCKVIPE